MTISADDELLFLVPEDSLKKDDWLSSDLVSDLVGGMYVMCGHKNFGYSATVVSNEYYNKVINGISVDAVDGFGIIISCSPKHKIMTKWEEVLSGQRN